MIDKFETHENESDFSVAWRLKNKINEIIEIFSHKIERLEINIANLIEQIKSPESKDIHSQETKPNGVAINNMSKAPRDDVQDASASFKVKTPDTRKGCGKVWIENNLYWKCKEMVRCKDCRGKA